MTTTLDGSVEAEDAFVVFDEGLFGALCQWLHRTPSAALALGATCRRLRETIRRICPRRRFYNAAFRMRWTAMGYASTKAEELVVHGNLECFLPRRPPNVVRRYRFADGCVLEGETVRYCLVHADSRYPHRAALAAQCAAAAHDEWSWSQHDGWSRPRPSECSHAPLDRAAEEQGEEEMEEVPRGVLVGTVAFGRRAKLGRGDLERQLRCTHRQVTISFALRRFGVGRAVCGGSTVRWHCPSWWLAQADAADLEAAFESAEASGEERVRVLRRSFARANLLRADAEAEQRVACGESAALVRAYGGDRYCLAYVEARADADGGGGEGGEGALDDEGAS